MNVHCPRTLSEAVQMKAQHPSAALLAGGTDLLPRWHASGKRPESVILLAGIPALEGIETGDGCITIRGCTSHASLARDECVLLHLPALASAARSIGAPAVRNMGTIGGNLANASPAADLPPALMAHGASLKLVSHAGTREVPLERFFVGYQKTLLTEDEIIEAVTVPIPRAVFSSRFFKLGTRRAQSIAKVSVAGFAQMGGNRIRGIRLAAGSVAEIPVRLREAEAVLLGRELQDEIVHLAAMRATESIHPIDDVRSTASYRRQMIRVLVQRCIEDITGRSK